MNQEAYKSGYQEGESCGHAKRWCAARGLSGWTNEELTNQIPFFCDYAQNDNSSWFRGFYQGIADVLEVTA